MKNPKSILITGSSSGIGAELARQYAAPGVTLWLTGRDAVRLSKVALECSQKGAVVDTRIMDIVDDANMVRWIKSIQRLDLVIANAGISGGTVEGENDDAVREIFSVNVGGVLNTVLPAIKKLRSQPPIQGLRGQIAIVSSVAGLRGLPSAPAYSASKACMLAYGEALRGSLHADQIGVSVICPGYVKTPLTDQNNFYMPFIMSVEKAASKIKKKLSSNPPKVRFPIAMYGALKVASVLPQRITDPIFRKFPRKNSQ
jgi:short-subunit dehydrogenase